MLPSRIPPRRLCHGSARTREWSWLLALIVALGLAVVHAHLPSASDLSFDRVAAMADLPEPAGTDWVDPGLEAVSDLELVASEATSPPPSGLPADAAAAEQFSSRAVAPRERPPRTDQIRA